MLAYRKKQSTASSFFFGQTALRNFFGVRMRRFGNTTQSAATYVVCTWLRGSPLSLTTRWCRRFEPSASSGSQAQPAMLRNWNPTKAREWWNRAHPRFLVLPVMAPAGAITRSTRKRGCALLGDSISPLPSRSYVPSGISRGAWIPFPIHVENVAHLRHELVIELNHLAWLGPTARRVSPAEGYPVSCCWRNPSW